MKFVVLFCLILTAMIATFMLKNRGDTKGKILHLLSKKGYLSNERIEIYSANKDEIERLINNRMTAKEIVAQILSSEDNKNRRHKPSTWIPEFLSNPFFLYLFFATIIVIFIGIITDGSGPYTGGDAEYIWKPSRR